MSDVVKVIPCKSSFSSRSRGDESKRVEEKLLGAFEISGLAFSPWLLAAHENRSYREVMTA